jgi:hypothetical protein
MTDEEVREMGLKEVYPGYFQDDPRHPYWNVEDRYRMDHPGPDWKTKPKLQRDPDQPYRGKGVGWDEEQFSGTPWHPEPLPPRPVRKIIPISSGDAERVAQALRHESDPFIEPSIRQSGFWICRICRKALALWPSERALRLKPFGLSLTVVFRSPLACTNCRIFEFPTIQKLGNEDHRKFWQRVIACWEHPQLLIPRTWYRKALGFQKSIRNALTYRSRL